jgi:hypothetical protein
VQRPENEARSAADLQEARSLGEVRPQRPHDQVVPRSEPEVARFDLGQQLEQLVRKLRLLVRGEPQVGLARWLPAALRTLPALRFEGRVARNAALQTTSSLSNQGITANAQSKPQDSKVARRRILETGMGHPRMEAG